MRRKPLRVMLLVALGVFFTFALLDTIGVFNEKPYYEVPHGDHSHYVPRDCDPELPFDRTPTTEPGPGMRIDCVTGQIIPDTP